MFGTNHLSKVFETSKIIHFDDSSKIVLMSDCHRGDGTLADNFAKNQNVYFVALSHYYRENFTYIELGDGDELWENSEISDIIHMHNNIYWLLTEFYKKNKLYFIFGNHDIVKKNKNFIKENLGKYVSNRQHKEYPLFENLTIHEGLVLMHRISGHKIFLVHGHQVDFINSSLWVFSRFLVRNLWRRLELFGFSDPTRASQNNKIKLSVEKKLTEWVKKEKQMLIAGHTHRPLFPEVVDPPYFNDGSCVHPRHITTIEISCGSISLVKWQIKAKLDGTLYVGRELVAGPTKLKDYFNYFNYL